MGRIGGRRTYEKKGTHVSSSPPFVPFSLFSQFFSKKNVNNAFKSFLTIYGNSKKINKLHKKIPCSIPYFTVVT
jgi:hypothetical protein